LAGGLQQKPQFPEALLYKVVSYNNMSELARALDQISEIHEQMAKGEVFRGYRPLPIAICGVVGICAAALQQFILPAFAAAGARTGFSAPQSFVMYWVLAAALSAAVPACVIAWRYAVTDDTFGRRTTNRVVGQFLPCIAAGILITAAIFVANDSSIRLLPGLWSALFALGIFSSRPYLPRAAGWVALFFLAGGAFMLTRAEFGYPFLGMCLGLVFGLGQFATAAVLYLNIERKSAS
jgi:hypothetical protein